MATGTTNPMMYTNNIATIADHTHSVEEITGLSTHLDKIQATESLLNQVELLLRTCDNLLSANGYATKDEVVLLGQYTSEIQDIRNQLDLVLKEDLEDGFSSLKENQITLQAAVEGLNAKVGPLLGEISGYATEVAGFSAIASGMSEALTALQEAVAALELANETSTTSADIEKLKGDVANAQAAVSDLTTALTARSVENGYLKTALKGYLTLEDDGKTVKDATELQPIINDLITSVEELQSTLPTALEIERVTDVEPFKQANYLDYQLTFKNGNNPLGDLSKRLTLTDDVNTYIDYRLAEFISNYLQTRLLDSDTRLDYFAKCLANLTQHVACLASHHNFVIRNIRLYFADGLNGIGLLPASENELLKVATNFQDSARIDNKALTPSEVIGRNFYIIFETSYPIDLDGDRTVSLGFPDFQEGSNIKAAPEWFKCTRLGVPDITSAVYVLHTTVDSDATELTPFTFGKQEHVFGQLFTQEGTYEFMLKVTDPYNSNITAEKAKQITIGYPIYYGICAEDSLSAELFAASTTFTLLHTEFNSPATTLDWTKYNNETEPTYYYYVVPNELLSGKTLSFNTGYGPGGWIMQNDSITLNEVDYTVFRTEYKITYCPSTLVTAVNIPN